MEWLRFLKRTFPTITRYAAAGCVGLALASGPVRADDSKEIQEIKARMERLEKQNADLISALQAQQLRQAQTVQVMQQPDGAPAGTGSSPAAPRDKAMEKQIDDYLKKLKDDEANKKKEEEEKKLAEGYVVGSDTKGGLKWEDGWLWMRTPNDDFTMHIGAWLQMDKVWWTQTPALKAPQGSRAGPKQGVASGTPLGGIGDLEDGFYFRRIRPFVEGTFYETYEYRINLAAENNQFNTEGLDEVWVGVNKVPFIGTIRVGHLKNAWGLEGDMTSSSRTMTFMERSSMTEAIYLNQNFGTGLFVADSYLDDRVTTQSTLTLPDNGASSGTFFGDGQYGANTRITALPLYQDDGRHLMHVGGSLGWRDGASNNAVSPYKVVTLQARPEMRDDDPAGGGPTVIPNSNSNRMVSTGALAIKDYWTLGTEYLYIHGPFSVQAEYAWGFADNVMGIAPSGFKFNPAIKPSQDYTFSGGYIQVCYTLTGENRAYDKKLGCLARDYFKGGPYTNAWFTRDPDGHLCVGWGAWELAARYTYLDLNDGSGNTRIQGGIMEGIGLGVNWYLNRDLKVQFQWNYDHRYDLPKGAILGNANGFGIETQLSF
jgi:phosphate-selective porin OprO/OprP